MTPEEATAKRKARYAANQEKEQAYARAYYQSHKEEARKAKARYYVANREKERARVKAWQVANPLAFAMGNKTLGANKRARGYGITERVTRDDVMAAFEKSGWTCAMCGKRLDLDGHLDHIEPFGIGGRNHRDNLQALHAVPCHRDKSIEDCRRIKASKADAVTEVTA